MIANDTVMQKGEERTDLNKDRKKQGTDQKAFRKDLISKIEAIIKVIDIITENITSIVHSRG